MQSPDSETLSPPVSVVPPLPNFRGRWWIRIALFVLHIATLAAAISLTPPGYFFELGTYTGSILLFGSIFLWWLLCSAKTRRGILLYCILALVQAGFMALVGLHFQAEDRVLRPILSEFAMKRIEWASQMEEFRMDPLFEMTSGKRQLSVGELRELQMRARAAEAKLGEVQSETMRAIADAESRIAAVSSGAARDFRSGVESTRPESDETMKLMQNYFAQIEQLTVFLTDRQGQYSQTTNGLVFRRDEDAQLYKKQVDSMAHLQEQLNSRSHGGQADRWNQLNAQLMQLVSSGRPADAVPVGKEALDVAKKTFGTEHDNYGMSLNNLAWAYSLSGNYSEAEPLFKKSISVFEKLESPELARPLGNLANMYAAQSKYVQAEAAASRSLEVLSKSYGPDSVNTVAAESALALIDANGGNPAEAERLYRDALATEQKTLPPDHIELGRTYENLGYLYETEGKRDEAADLYRKALTIFEKTLSPRDPLILATQQYLARVSPKAPPVR